MQNILQSKPIKNYFDVTFRRIVIEVKKNITYSSL